MPDTLRFPLLCSSNEHARVSITIKRKEDWTAKTKVMKEAQLVLLKICMFMIFVSVISAHNSVFVPSIFVKLWDSDVFFFIAQVKVTSRCANQKAAKVCSGRSRRRSFSRTEHQTSPSGRDDGINDRGQLPPSRKPWSSAGTIDLLKAYVYQKGLYFTPAYLSWSSPLKESNLRPSPYFIKLSLAPSTLLVDLTWQRY